MKKLNIIFDNLKKIVCLVFAILFYILGIIGLIIPIVPQVPFFILGTVFMVIGFKSLKAKIMESKFYKEHIESKVSEYWILKVIFGKNE